MISFSKSLEKNPHWNTPKQTKSKANRHWSALKITPKHYEESFDELDRQMFQKILIANFSNKAKLTHKHTTTKLWSSPHSSHFFAFLQIRRDASRYQDTPHLLFWSKPHITKTSWIKIKLCFFLRWKLLLAAHPTMLFAKLWALFLLFIGAGL